MCAIDYHLGGTQLSAWNVFTMNDTKQTNIVARTLRTLRPR